MATAKKKTAKKRKKPKKIGRPKGSGILSEELISKLTAVYRPTGTYREACAKVGLSERTFRHWMNRGREELERLAELQTEGKKPRAAAGEAIYVKLIQAMALTKAETVEALSTVAIQGALGRPAQFLKNADGTLYKDKDGNAREIAPYLPPNPRLALEILSRWEPEQWGKKAQVELSTAKEGPSELRITVIDSREVPPRKRQD